MFRLRYLFFVFILAGALCACESRASEAIELQPGENAVCGQIKNTPAQWNDRSLFVYAANFSGSPEGGYYVLEPDLHPHTELDKNGDFCMRNLPDGAYMLLAGPDAEEALRLVDRDGQPLVIEIQTGDLLELGKIIPIQ